nr:MAG TPA: hypothetical protein [Herelleviridae sp.]
MENNSSTIIVYSYLKGIDYIIVIDNYNNRVGGMSNFTLPINTLLNY